MLNQKYCNKCSGWVKNSHIHFLDGQQKIFTGPKRKFCADCKDEISQNAKRCVPCSQVARQRPRKRQCLSCKKIFKGVPSDKYYGFCSEECRQHGKLLINCNTCSSVTATLDKRTCKNCLYKQKNKKICKICKNVFYEYLKKNSYLQVCSEKCLTIGNFCINCHSPLHKKHNLCFKCDKLALDNLPYFTCSVCLLLKQNTLKQKDDICIDCK